MIPIEERVFPNPVDIEEDTLSTGIPPIIPANAADAIRAINGWILVRSFYP